MKGFFLFLLITITVISCKKDIPNNNTDNSNDSSSIPLGTITAYINGVFTNFSYCHVDTLLCANGPDWIYSIFINGSYPLLKGNKANKPSIQIQILKSPYTLTGIKNFVVGSYPSLGTTGADTVFTTGIYYDTTSMILYNFNAISRQFTDTLETANFLYSDYTSGYSFSPVTITSINDSTIRGTFSGVLMINDVIGNPVIITNGKFYVPLH